MRPPVQMSFRQQTAGCIRDLMNDEGISCSDSQDMLCYFAGALINYTEEGVVLMPSILFCTSIEDTLTPLIGAVHHVIGIIPLKSNTAPKILKDCAPLSGKNWYIFVQKNDDSVTYGVFTYCNTPTAIPLSEGISINPDQFSILLRKTSTNTICLTGAKKNHLSLIFSTSRDISNTIEPIENFVQTCCAGIGEENLRKEFFKYFSRFLENSLSSCHGTILACGNDIDFEGIAELQDAVKINPNIDLFQCFADYKKSESAASILALQRCEELLIGFLRCDGIIIFNDSGSVSAYRVFFKSITPPEATDDKIVGGARKRAFEGLKSLVGKNINAALFRSQDGQTDFYGGK